MIASTVLVVAAHPDDEVLGCGGTIAKYVANGCIVRVAFLADGVSSRQVKGQELSERRLAAKAACRILGTRPPSFAEFPDNRMDTVALLDVAKEIEGLIAQFQPHVLITHHAGDVNVDHQRIHQAAVVACRPQQGLSVQTLLFFEVASSTEWQVPGSAPPFAPNWFVDIGDFMERKLAALNAYEAELRPWPHPRSLKGVQHLARWRGASIGCEAAEAFVLGRQLT